MKTVVMGGSVGAFQRLKQIITEPPSDLPAAMLIVLHIQPEPKNLLAENLGRCA